MKMKWYISTLILVLTIFGICHNKIFSPNQEILVEFQSNKVTAEQSQTAIASIKQQLKEFGIDDIQVREDQNGLLKITYYSAVDVESIKEILSAEKLLSIGFDSVENEKGSDHIPSDKKSKTYNLDIYELYKSTDGNNGAAGKSVLIVKQDFDRYLNPNVFLPINCIDVTQTDLSLKQAYKINSVISIEIKNASHAIPEVRAGPQFLGYI